jgi:type II secretory pathway pseudopilin PulG
MTTSAVRTRNSLPAFTLLEIVIVLVIISVTIGGAIGFMVFSSDDRELQQASGEVEVLAKRARTISILHQTPYAIEFRPGKIRLLPLAEAGGDEKLTALGRTIGGSRVDVPDPDGRSPVRDEISLSGDISLYVRRWNSDVLQPMNDRVAHVWRFDPDGLTEPIGVRFVLGNSWREDAYHPLTATIQDTQSEIQ